MGKRARKYDSDGDSDSDKEKVPSSRKEMVAAAGGTAEQGQGFKNKEKVLILSTRGITFRYVTVC